jgi:chorismate synthase
MASNSFGTLFKFLTWGEAHGKAIGVVVDGCPAGVAIDDHLINEELFWRAPGKQVHTSARKEPDKAEILSGVFEGKTTGTPISIVIWNQDVQSQHYEPIKNVLRPGHANYTYIKKYGCFDYRGGGRASARETACRVAAGAIAKQILSDAGVFVIAYLHSVGSVQANFKLSDVPGQERELQSQIRRSPLFCPDASATESMQAELSLALEEKDSLGGVVEAVAFNVPAGWGDPVYEKLEANLAKAMLSLPASKGFEIGAGYASTLMKGSQHNDLFYAKEDNIRLSSNHAGGTLGGISTGMPIIIRVAFKPTSSIGKEQKSVNFQNQPQILSLPVGSQSRHDPCVAIRAVPVVEAMFALALVDAMLMNRHIVHQYGAR